MVEIREARSGHEHKHKQSNAVVWTTKRARNCDVVKEVRNPDVMKRYRYRERAMHLF